MGLNEIVVRFHLLIEEAFTILNVPVTVLDDRFIKINKNSHYSFSKCSPKSKEL